MSSNIRSWIVWLTPFLVSFGMAFGVFIGASDIGDAAMQEGPAGDLAGAAGALMVAINLLVGFTMAIITIIVAKLFRRIPPERITLSLCLSFIGAVIIGAIVAYAEQEKLTAAAWFILISGPALLAWFCGTRKPLPALTN